MSRGSVVDERLHELRHVVASLNELVGDRFEPAPLIAAYGEPVEPTYSSYKACLDTLQEIDSAISELEDPQRASFVREMVHALSVFTRECLDEMRPYGQRVEAYAGVPGSPVPLSTIEAMQRAVSDKLARLGIAGPMECALETWRSSQQIEPKRLAERIELLVGESRALANRNILKVPVDCALDVELVHGVFYQGYSEYHGNYRGTVRINADLPWTNAGLKSLIAHEGYAGHFLLNAVSDERARQGKLPPESSFYFANTPNWPIIEGTCNMGVYLLGWFCDIHDEIQELLSRLRSALLINIAFLRHQDAASDSEIVAAFTCGGFFSQEQAAQALRFIDHPLFHPSIPAYWHGTRVAFDALHVGLRTMSLQEVVNQLYRRGHTCATLGAWTATQLPGDRDEHWILGETDERKGV